MNNKWQWIVLALLIFLAILFYINVIIPYWPFLLFPVIKFLSAVGIKGQVVVHITIILMDFVGELIIALLFSMPLGYITKERSIYFGFLLGLGLVLYMLWLHLHCYQAPWWTTFNTVVVVCEYIGTILAFIIMSKVGGFVRCYRKRKTT